MHFEKPPPQELNISGNYLMSPFYIQEADDTYDSPNHLLVQLNPDNIVFGFEVTNHSNPTEIFSFKPILKLPLDHPEKTSSFLLHINSYNIPVKSNDQSIKLPYRNFIPNKKLLENNGKHTRTTAAEILLGFFDDLMDNTSIIKQNYNDLAKYYSSKLHESQTYNLINTKFVFLRLLYEWVETGKNDKELGFRTKASFAETIKLLTNDSLVKTISYRYFSETNWFENPETEMDYLIELNKNYQITDDYTKEIRGWFLQKHSILSAIKLDSVFKLRIAISGNLITSLIFGIVFILWLFNYYRHTDILALIGMAVFLSFNIFQFFFKPNLATHMPRIIVATATAWFLLISSEDNIKNQFDVFPNIVFIGSLIFIILNVIFIFAECKQHSPYYSMGLLGRLHRYKVLPTFIYTFNVTAFLGIIFHATIIGQMLDRTNALRETTFNPVFNKTETLNDDIQNYIAKISSAKQYCAMSYLAISNTKIESYIKNDTINIQPIRNENIEYTRVHSTIGNVLQMYFKNYADIINDLNRIEKEKGFEKYMPSIPTLRDLEAPLATNTALKTEKNLQKIARQLEKNFLIFSELENNCYTLLDSVRQRLNTDNKKLSEYTTYMHTGDFERTKKCLSCKDDEKWLELNFNPNHNYGFCYDSTRIYMINPFSFMKIDEAEDNFLAETRVFPKMLILQIFLVMTLAIVGQLIIADKSITEAL